MHYCTVLLLLVTVCAACTQFIVRCRNHGAMALCTLWASEVEREPWMISAAIDHSLQAFGHARTCEDHPSAGSSSELPPCLTVPQLCIAADAVSCPPDTGHWYRSRMGGTVPCRAQWVMVNHHLLPFHCKYSCLHGTL